MASKSGRKYKIKLTSGRILGPIDLDRIRLLILKNQIVGEEVAREHPHGNWVDINLIAPIADLLVSKAKGTLQLETTATPSLGREPGQGTTRMIPEQDLSLGLANSEPEYDPAQDEKTVVAIPTASQTSDATPVVRKEEERHLEEPSPERPEASEQTILLEKTGVSRIWSVQDAIRDPRKAGGVLKNQFRDIKSQVVATLATLALIYIVYTLLFSVAPAGRTVANWTPVRPALPRLDSSLKDPAVSGKYYNEAMKYYLMDNVPAYKAAVGLLERSVKSDSSNVKALALLASCYLNLIDSSNKDENYFSVISKLIEFSRAKDVDLAETVIADVEFYITVNKAGAAENRIVEYTKVQTTFGLEMFYYLALAFYHRGDAQSAVRYISQYPENRAFSPKLFYLRGQIAEKLGDSTAAIQEYEKAIKMNPNHAKSRLAIANIMDRSMDLQGAAVHLEYLNKHPRLLAPRDLARAYYLHAKLNEGYRKNDIAVGDLQRAVALEKDNHEYLLELYMMLAKSGENVKSVQPNARMYYFLGEGEKLLKNGKYQEALTQFLQARQSNDKSPVPLVKIGDMFLRMNNLGNARINYRMAAERAPNSIEVWSKYIDVLIQSYDWSEAITAMDKFRKLPVPQSAIDKAAADMYAKQGNPVEAQNYYRKAMARDTIDSTVYIAYAKSLMETRNYKDAPFFFALALRFDPLNVDALVGTAKCIAATESIERGISMLQDELQKGTVARAELLAAIADFYMQKGAWKQAQEYIKQAMAADPDYAYPWKLQARLYMNDAEGSSDKALLNKALDAYSSYSDRNNSDPSGYLERYRIFVKKSEFEKASEELGKIFAIYPKYPNLHFYKGALYSIMGNQKLAMDEYQVELQNNPNSVPTLIALGKEYEKSGGVEQAITLFNKAMQISPRSPEAKIESGYANYLLKNYAGAIALYNAALQLDPGNPLTHKRLGLAYREMGDRPSAAQAFRKYFEMQPDAPDRAELEIH